MQKFVLFLLIGFYSTDLFCQTVPTFLLQFNFEDSKGNKDTLWIGGDMEGSYTEIQSQFGEVEITTPFDSVFEVRAVHVADTLWRTSKIIVEDSGNPNDYLGAPTRIMIHAKYPPVRISWDSSYLDPTSIFDRNKILFPYVPIDPFFQYWWGAEYVYCMITTDHMIENFDYDYTIPVPFLFHEFEVEGQGMVNIPGLHFAGVFDFQHCQTTLLDVNEFVLPNTFNVYPNPTKGKLNIVYEQEGLNYVKIYDVSGKLVHSEDINNIGIHQIQLSDLLPSGIYLLESQTDFGQVLRQTFVLER